MLKREDSLLLIIDIQEKLVRACKDVETISKRASILANSAQILSIPTVITEQYPQGLGATVEEIKTVAPEAKFVEKTYFSALKEEGFKDLLASYGKKQIILCGIEAHICVYQTCLELLDLGYEVYVAEDCCSSRKEYEFIHGINLMKNEGAKISCVEMILFEWLEGAKNPKFKEVQQLIK